MNSVFAVPIWVGTDNEDDIKDLVGLHLKEVVSNQLKVTVSCLIIISFL